MYKFVLSWEITCHRVVKCRVYCCSFVELIFCLPSTHTYAYTSTVVIIVNAIIYQSAFRVIAMMPTGTLFTPQQNEGIVIIMSVRMVVTPDCEQKIFTIGF